MNSVSIGSRLIAAPLSASAMPAVASRRQPPQRCAAIFWTFQGMFWLAITVALLGIRTAYRPEEPIQWILMPLRAGMGFVVTSLVYWLFQTERLRGLPRALRWPLMMGCVVALLYGLLLILVACGVGGPTDWSSEKTYGPMATRLVGAALWCGFVFALEVIEDLYEAEILLADTKAAATDVELRMMQAEAVARTCEVRQLQEQMSPHFLFNALNAVVARKHDPDGVENVTRDLADYLRFTLGEARPLEPLSRELRALEKYLGVQQARFGEDLCCRVCCDRAAHSVLVPPMLIQPLLENAINYGAKTSRMPLRAEVTARVVDSWLEVVVANSGRWVPPDPARSPSTGIRSLRKRLALLVGDHATVETRIEPDQDDGWVRVVIRVPATLAQPPSAAADPALVQGLEPASELHRI